jgi:hypothetical protein
MTTTVEDGYGDGFKSMTITYPAQYNLCMINSFQQIASLSAVYRRIFLESMLIDFHELS